MGLASVLRYVVRFSLQHFIKIDCYLEVLKANKGLHCRVKTVKYYVAIGATYKGEKSLKGVVIVMSTCISLSYSANDKESFMSGNNI